MRDLTELSQEIESLLRLRTHPIAYKRLEKADELQKIPGVVRLNRGFTFCQLPTLARRSGLTIGVTREDSINRRCARLNGLAPTTEEAIEREARNFATYSWFATIEEARKQLAVYPLIPPGEAIVLAPLSSAKFDPDVVLIYGTPAQLMMLMCGLQFMEFERYQSFFTGEGACVDGLAQCYVSGKPALAIPCYGERAFGSVEEDELVLALPPGMMPQAVEGLQGLATRGLSYPVGYFGPGGDPLPALAQRYPAR